VINAVVASMTLQAILFDLYGTLVKAADRPFSRRLPEALGVPRDAWMALVRAGLLTRAFEDTAAFAEYVARALAPERLPAAAAACAALVEAECASVALVPGTASLLAFLKRRGLKLGLVSNLASPFKASVAALGLEAAFDTAAYSCDEGLTKPDPEIYIRALGRLGVSPEHALFVGDNPRNDVNAPAALGLLTAGVGVRGRDATLRSAAEIGLLDFSATRLARLLGPGHAVEVGDVRGRVESITPTSEGEQGRYNLVFRCEIGGPHGAVVYAKRFLLPETVQVETFAYRLQALTGLRACTAAIHPGSEDLLLITTAPGRKWEDDLCEQTAYGLGAHFVFALLFSNADIRPRNAFVDDGQVTLVDLEHCFFNLAIDTTGLADPERPETFDRMPPDELVARTKKKVLSARATSRARRSFFADTVKGSPVDEAFHAGFVDFYRRLHARTDEITSVILERVHAEPPLVIGTHGYRRALAEVDVADIRSRLMMDAQVAYDGTW
jgi:HAD superfamily hydrolase (TIGR01549 family)